MAASAWTPVPADQAAWTPVESTKPAQQGFLGSFSDSSGLSALGNAVLHPIDTVTGIPAAIVGEGKRVVGDVKQGVSDYQKTGLSEMTRRDFGRAIPIVGPALATAQAQHDAGNDAGMAGTMAGTVAGLAAPSILKEAGPSLAATTIKVAQGPLKGVSFVLDKAGRAAEFTGATTQTQKLMASRLLVAGTPGELLQRGLKQGVKYGADAPQMYEDTLPSVLKVNPNTSTVSQFADASDAARAAQGAQYDARVAPYRKLPVGSQGPAQRPSLIPGGPIADAQIQSVPAMDAFEARKATSGGVVNNTAAKAEAYRTGMDVPLLDDIRQDSNAKLNAFYNKAGGDRNAALSNPETARVKAVGDSTRQLLYERLAKDAGITPGDIEAEQQLYGKLANTSDIANKREVVFNRQDPVSLAEKIATSHGGPVTRATNLVVQKTLKSLTDPDALVSSAVDRFKNPIETAANPSSNPILGVISQAGTVSRTAAKAILKGQDKWAQLGLAKLADHVGRDSASAISSADVEALSKTTRGKNLLIQASDLNPGSRAMKNLVKQIPLALATTQQGSQ